MTTTDPFAEARRSPSPRVNRAGAIPTAEAEQEPLRGLMTSVGDESVR